MSRKAKFIQFTACGDVASLPEVLRAIGNALEAGRDGIAASRTLCAPGRCPARPRHWNRLGGRRAHAPFRGTDARLKHGAVPCVPVLNRAGGERDLGCILTVTSVNHWSTFEQKGFAALAKFASRFFCSLFSFCFCNSYSILLLTIRLPFFPPPSFLDSSLPLLLHLFSCT